MNEPLDGESVVVDDEDYRFETKANHGADLLNGELEGAIAYEEDCATVGRGVSGGKRRALSCAN